MGASRWQETSEKVNRKLLKRYPWEKVMNRSDYEVVRVEEDRVFIIDLDLGNKSVTNDAEEVLKEIQFHFPGRRLIYRDTLGKWDEIVEDNYSIIYNSYFQHLPEESEIKNFPSSELLRKK